MALTKKVWYISAMVGCAAIALTYLPPTKGPPAWYRYVEGVGGPVQNPARRSAQALRRRLQQPERSLALLKRRDQILEWANTLDESTRQDVPLLIDPELPNRWKDLISATLEPELEYVRNSLRPRSSEVMIPVAVVRDSKIGGGMWHLLPMLAGDDACITIWVLSEWQFARLEDTRNPAGRLYSSLGAGALGPCAYYGAFGRAGPSIGEWFGTLGYRFGYDIYWTRLREPGPFAQEWERQGGLTGRGSFPWVDLSLDEAKCTAGKTEACAAVMMDVRRDYFSWWVWNRQVSTSGALSGAWRSRNVRRFLRGEGQHLLADLIRETGSDRFARFWRSSEPVGEAFASAMGEPLERWVVHWAGEKLKLSGTPPAGPAPPAGSAALGLALAMLVVTWAAVYGARRQVS